MPDPAPDRSSAPTRVPARQLVAVVVALITIALVAVIAWTLTKGRESLEPLDAAHATGAEEGWSPAIAPAALPRPKGDPNSVSSVGWLHCGLLTPPDDNGARASISFELWAPGLGEQGVACVRNGGELIDVDHKWTDERTLLVEFPHYDSTLRLRRGEASGYEGLWLKFTSAGSRVSMEAHAAPLDVQRRGDDPWGAAAPVQSAAPPLAAGEWKMQFESSGAAKGVFREAPGSALPDAIVGTILTPTGDYRYLSGVSARTAPAGDFYLSVFDGAHAFAFQGRVEGDRMEGVFRSGASWKENFTAQRVPPGETFDLPDAFSEVAIRPGETTLRIPQMEHEDFADKPVIVVLFGTWCPNCHDEAPVLRDLYERHEAEGLRILGLAYEHTNDAHRAMEQIGRFVERHGVQWDIVFAGLSDKQQAAATMPSLSAVKAFPTTIFLNRDHTVRAIHSGFAGPATGDEHTQLKAEFERLTREIVQSRAAR